MEWEAFKEAFRRCIPRENIEAFKQEIGEEMANRQQTQESQKTGDASSRPNDRICPNDKI